jgi:hypothetical protein
MNYRDAEKYFEKSSLCLCVSVAFDNICHEGTENTEICLKSLHFMVLTFRIGSKSSLLPPFFLGNGEGDGEGWIGS